MSCDFASSFLQGYFDGELNRFRATEFERHLSHCAECATELLDLDFLSTKLQLARLYAPAPPALRPKVRAHFSPGAISPAASKPLLWHWLAAAAALLLFAIAGWRVNCNLSSNDYQSEFADEIIDAHMTSLHPGKITGIASNDPHLVKEWLESTLKFTVPVRDFGKEGFPLQGGRVDAVEGRPLAALVYVHDGHTINVFICPTEEPDNSPRTGSRQGYRWVAWRKTQVEFCAVSNAGLPDLERLQGLILESLSGDMLIPGQSRAM